MLMHETVQPLLDARSDPENPEEKTVGRPLNIDTVWLRGKRFPVSRYPTKKMCAVRGYNKNAKEKQARKKINNFCEKCNLPIRKSVFKCFIQRAKYNIHIYSTFMRNILCRIYCMIACLFLYNFNFV